MTIDEAIEMYKKIANTDSNCPRYCMNPCEDCVQQCRKIAEWLEELKALRHEANEWRKAGYSHVYNKAIDDFKSMLEERILAGKMIDEKFAYIDNCDIDEIAEHLKPVGENEQKYEYFNFKFYYNATLFDIYFALNVVLNNKLLTVLSDMINFIIHEK